MAKIVRVPSTSPPPPPLVVVSAAPVSVGSSSDAPSLEAPPQAARATIVSAARAAVHLLRFMFLLFRERFGSVAFLFGVTSAFRPLYPPVSAFEATGEASDHVSLQEEEDEQDRRHTDHKTREDQRPLGDVLVDEAEDGHGNRLVRCATQIEQWGQEVVPDMDSVEDDHGAGDRSKQRKDDLPERPRRTRPIDPSHFL